MERWIANIVDAINVLFFGFAILAVCGIVVAAGFHLGRALGPWWWALACLTLLAAIVGWSYLETIRVDEKLREFWARSQRD